MEIIESILTSIKKMLGITEEYEHFDSDLIMHINSVFMILTQLGVGPPSGFSIRDKTSIWKEFVSDETKFQLVKSYMHLKVKLLFDPPLSSAVMASMEKMIAEAEWRLNVSTFPSKDLVKTFSAKFSKPLWESCALYSASVRVSLSTVEETSLASV